MTNKGQQKFDGLPVVLYDGRFSGAFELDEQIGENIAYDDVVTFLVTAVAGKVAIDATKSGDLKRTNTFEVTSSEYISASQAFSFLEQIKNDVEPEPQQSFDELLDAASPDETDDDSFLDEIDEEEIFKPGTKVVATVSQTSDPALKSFLESV